MSAPGKSDGASGRRQHGRIITPEIISAELDAITDVAARKARAREMVPALRDLSPVDRQSCRDVLKTVGGLSFADQRELQDALTPPAGGRAGRLRSVTDIPAVPHRLINIDSAYPWRYDTGDDGSLFPRGGYQRRPVRPGDGTELDFIPVPDVDDGDSAVEYRWVPRFDLPHVLARVIRRDASGSRLATDYLISADQDGQPSDTRAVITDDDVTTGAWAGKIGALLSVDRTIVTAAGTAIRDHARRDAPEREATPRPDTYSPTGHLDLPIRECLPGGYLRTPPVRGRDDTEAEADRFDAMYLIGEIATERPRLALTMGASAAGPFVGPLKHQSFWHDVSGEPRMGKSTALAVAASLWGEPRIGTGVIVSWNATGRGPGRYLGQLGCLPGFFDERGMAKFGSSEWGQLIFETTMGNSRLAAEYKGAGTTRSVPWHGVLFSTGNSRLVSDLGGGGFSGIPARVIELEAPVTADAAESELIMGSDRTPGLIDRAYGWLGDAILHRYTVDDVRDLIAHAASVIGSPDGGTPRTIAGHLHLEVAGAMMIDTILGLEGRLTASATAAAVEYLAEHATPPEHDADQVMALLGEWLSSNRAAWPTATEYAAHGSRSTGFGSESLPGYGQADRIDGIRSDDGEWVYVYPQTTWRRAVTETEASGAVALRELWRRGHLKVTASARARGAWTLKLPRLGDQGRPPVYCIATAAVTPPDSDETELTGPTPDAAPVVPESVPHEPENQPSEASDSPQDEAPTSDTDPGREDADEDVNGEDKGEEGHKSGRRAQRAELLTLPLAEARAKVFAEARAVVDSGGPFLASHALASSFVPRRRVDKQMRRAAIYRRQDEHPAHIPVHSVRGFCLESGGTGWSRPYAGPVVGIDRNGAYPSSAASVGVSHGPLTHTGAIAYDRKRAGLFQVDRFWWTEDGLPHPLGVGQPKGNTVWLTGPTVELLISLAEAGRWPDVTILDSWTAPACRMSDWTTYIQDFRRHALEQGEAGREEYLRVKEGISTTFGLMRGQDNGRRPNPKSPLYVPDWYQTIESHLAATLWRTADKCLRVVPDLGPVELKNIDELVIPADAYETLTGVPQDNGKPVIRIDQSGIEYGTFKVKYQGEYGGPVR